jgi:type IV pilus assembly protein PilC
MMVFVMPKMISLYGEFGTEMPAPTVMLLAVVKFSSKNAVLFPVLAASAFIALRIAGKSRAGKMKIDETKLKIPIVGNLLMVISLTEVTRTLGILLGTGVPLLDALKIVSDASGNEVFRSGLTRAAENVEKGLPLSDALSENPAFPSIVSQMIGTGEKTGKLDEILNNVSRYFETESEQKVKALTSAIEPLIMILLGLGVGFLVIAIIMPIYNLTSQF